jgi:hypothetical protein
MQSEMAAFSVSDDIYIKKSFKMRNLLLEMAVYSENDVFKMNPVASVSTKVTDELEGNELRKYVLQNFQSVEIQPNYKIDEHIVGELISHHCGHRQKKKAALLASLIIYIERKIRVPVIEQDSQFWHRGSIPLSTTNKAP